MHKKNHFCSIPYQKVKKERKKGIYSRGDISCARNLNTRKRGNGVESFPRDLLLPTPKQYLYIGERVVLHAYLYLHDIAVL
jgi:hypothetical protein